MKITGKIIGTLSLALLMVSCNKEVIKPSNSISSEYRAVSGFTNIKVEDALKVDISYVPGTEQCLVEANTNLLPYIITEVSGGTLFIHRKDNVSFKPGSKIHIYVTASQLAGLDISGASNVKLQNAWSEANVALEVSGASTLKGSMNSTTAYFDISGASSLDLSGTIGIATMDVSGASAVKDFDLAIDELTIDLSGASSASLTVNELLNVVCSGASTMNYSGDGVIGSINVSGASSVVKH